MEKLLDMKCLWRMSRTIKYVLFILYINHLQKEKCSFKLLYMGGFDQD